MSENLKPAESFGRRHQISRTDSAGRPIPICVVQIPRLDLHIEIDASEWIEEGLRDSWLGEHAEMEFSKVADEFEWFEYLEQSELGRRASEEILDLAETDEDYEEVVVILPETIMPFVAWKKPSYIPWMKHFNYPTHGF